MHVQSCCFAYRTPIAEGGARHLKILKMTP